MLLLRLSGHSGAGKSRLLATLKKTGLKYGQHILYTSRKSRDGESEGVSYYFRMRETIENFPRDRFLVGSVRQMLQAVDIDALEQELLSNDLIIIELFYELWPGVKKAIASRLGKQLKILSVFLTAVDPKLLRHISVQEAEKRIREHVGSILVRRGRDTPDEIDLRTNSAVKEIMDALNDEKAYDRIIVSAPEGPDKQDDWTREEYPVNKAAQTLKELLSIIQEKMKGGSK